MSLRKPVIYRALLMDERDFYRACDWVNDNSADETIWPLVRGWAVCAEFESVSDAIAFRLGSSSPWAAIDDLTLALMETLNDGLDPEVEIYFARAVTDQINMTERCEVSRGVEAVFCFRESSESAAFDKAVMRRDQPDPTL